MCSESNLFNCICFYKFIFHRHDQLCLYSTFLLSVIFFNVLFVSKRGSDYGLRCNALKRSCTSIPHMRFVLSNNVQQCVYEVCVFPSAYSAYQFEHVGPKSFYIYSVLVQQIQIYFHFKLSTMQSDLKIKYLPEIR